MAADNDVFAEVLTHAGIGRWKLEMEPGSAPRMYGDATMLRLLGIADDSIAPETLYSSWYEGIDAEHLPTVAEGIDRVVNGQTAEVQYPWHHPDGSTVVVRFGGVRDFDYKEGVRIFGTHQWVTELHHLERNRAREISAAEKTLSAIAKQLYGYNITVDLSDGSYSLIIGTGTDEAVGILQAAKDYREAYDHLLGRVRPEFWDRIRELCSLDFMRNHSERLGYYATLEYAVGSGELEHWEEMNISFGLAASGHPVAYILGRDITESRRATLKHEQELKAAAAKDQLLSGITQTLYGFNVTVNLKTGEYSLITGNGTEQICAVFEAYLRDDYSKACEVLFQHVDEAHKAEARELMSRDYLLGLRGRSGHIGTREFPWRSGDGSGHWCEVNVFMGANEVGDPVANILGRDISAVHDRQLQREREMIAAAAKDRILSEITRSIYGYNLTVNLSTLKCSLITGSGMDAVCAELEKHADYEEALRHQLEFVVPADRERVAEALSIERLRKLAEGGTRGSAGVLNHEVEAGGRHQWHETYVFIGANENGEPIANILGHDVSKAHEQAATEKKLEVVQQASAAKSKFLSNMSHDIRTPMNSILGMATIARAHILQREQKGVSEAACLQTVLGCLDKVLIGSRHMLGLVNDILDMSRMESGRLTINEQPFALDDLEEHVATLIRQQTDAKRQTFRNTENGVTHRLFVGDLMRLNQIFLYLLGNAVKFTAEKGVIGWEIAEKAGPTPEEATLVFTCSDNGCGMSPEFLPRLFDPFSRETRQSSEHFAGTGLGTAIVKQLVDLMHGEITVQSEPWKGTTFTLTIPFRIAAAAKSAAAAPAEAGAAAPEGEPGQAAGEAPAAPPTNGLELIAKYRFLVVEDVAANAEVITQMIELAGGRTEVAENGQKAVEMFNEAAEGHFDCILMDIRMPVMNGYDASRAIRAMKREDAQNIPIIAMTADASVEDVARAKEAGMNAHVSKPVRFKEFATTLAMVASGEIL